MLFIAQRFLIVGHRNTYQYELMQPVNASVVTGVAVQEEGSDRVVVMCRKDTRRMKYRTNVLVNDEIRYFDTMKMQRFEGKPFSYSQTFCDRN